jgi:protein-L-isoaspartate(D-aspartate) O-methyltransferase
LLEEIDFIMSVHTRTSRDYLERVVEHDKAECATIAKRFDKDVGDGARHHGYGGYRYDGRWLPVAQAMCDRYGIKAGDRILDVGCGRGFLMYEFTVARPGVEVAGLDVSAYAIETAKEEVKGPIVEGHARKLPWPDDSFDFVVSLNTLHNLSIMDLFSAVREIERVGRGAAKYIQVETYRNERQKANLMNWQLTCECFYTPEEWRWIYEQCGYTGDYGFIVFD